MVVMSPGGAKGFADRDVHRRCLAATGVCKRDSSVSMQGREGRGAAGLGLQVLQHGTDDFPEFQAWWEPLYDNEDVAPVFAWSTRSA